MCESSCSDSGINQAQVKKNWNWKEGYKFEIYSYLSSYIYKIHLYIPSHYTEIQ